MCSDGLTNMIEDDEIRHIVLGQRDIVEKAEKLIETANRMVVRIILRLY